MARLEEGEYGPGAGARGWLDGAATALPDPCWVCAECGAEHHDWQPLCPACGAFDTLQWRKPRGGGAAGGLPSVPTLAAAAPPLVPSAAERGC